jgi:multidrug efflux pump subunit AcrA (membrane-fusion protein)
MVIALLAVVLWPVHLTVLSPGELVPAHPTVVRAPLDGVIDVFHVQPNQLIKAEQALFSFDEIVIQSRLDVSLQALATAETDYRQTSQMALTDVKSKTQLGLLVGKVEERRAEIEYLQEQLTRARVLAPRDGVVLMDDPSEWIGKPVATGERILRIAALDDVEIEAWVSLADAISLSPGDSVTLYLGASPLSPVSAKLRYMSHEAVQRPDGSFAYRVRAALTSQTRHRVGLKGTAKLQGGWVPLSYWVLRRPWATVRAYLGW